MKKDAVSLLLKASEKVAETNVNSACMWFVYQPQIPFKVMKKYKK